MNFKEYMWTISIVNVIVFCFYPFFFKTFATSGRTFLVKDLTGVKVNGIRMAFIYCSTLPAFVYFSIHPIFGFIFHFGAFFFLIEASLVHKANFFKEYTELHVNRRCYRVRDVRLIEEAKNGIGIYKFFDFLTVLT